MERPRKRQETITRTKRRTRTKKRPRRTKNERVRRRAKFRSRLRSSLRRPVSIPPLTHSKKTASFKCHMSLLSSSSLQLGFLLIAIVQNIDRAQSSPCSVRPSTGRSLPSSLRLRFLTLVQEMHSPDQVSKSFYNLIKSLNIAPPQITQSHVSISPWVAQQRQLEVQVAVPNESKVVSRIMQ